MKTLLVLASQSPRRRELLEALSWPVAIRPADADESRLEAEDGPAMVQRLAKLKALTIYSGLRNEEKRRPQGAVLIVGADTTVDCEGRLLGKPASVAEAAEFLTALQKGNHMVHSGICVIDASTGRMGEGTHTSMLQLRSFSKREMQAYAQSGAGLDKAGGYGLQDRQFRPVKSLVGCAASVIGLPLGLFADICKRHFRRDLPCFFPASCSRLTGHPCCRAEET